jgi:hypothetical protein
VMVQEYAIRGDSENAALAGAGLILFLYLPALIMILRRSNVGAVAAPLEQHRGNARPQ